MRRIIKIVAVAAAALSVTIPVAGGSSTGAAEHAKGAVVAAESSVKADEAALTAAKAALTAAKETVTALEPAEPPKEEPVAGTVSAVPAGPASPSGSWLVEYADRFADPLTTDQTVKAGEHDQGCCSNSNEKLASERPSQVVQGPNGLELRCTKEVTVIGRPFTCGGVRTPLFRWKPGLGQTLVFEAVMQLPPRDEGEDPGWWSTDPAWTDEFDFFEGWEWEHLEYYAGVVWKAKTPSTVEVFHEAYHLLTEIPEPEARLHTYTTVVKANNEVQEWIDGVHRVSWDFGPPSSLNTPWMQLILTHALRVATKLAGTNSFTIRSVAVYEDSAHPGTGIEHGGIAPGTTVK